MGNLIALTLAVIVATGAFIWLAGSLLTALGWPFARVGSLVHKAMGTLPRNESDAWLFVLLLGVTRILVIVVGAVVFAASLSVILLPTPEIVLQLRDALLNIFIILLVMRLLAIFFGAVIIGGSVRSLLKTLRG
jgi:hypothetical protein